MCPDVYLLEKLIKGGFKGLNLGITKLGKDPFKAISSNREISWRTLPSNNRTLKEIKPAPVESLNPLYCYNHVPKKLSPSGWDQDTVVMSIREDGSNYVSYANVRTPSTWSSESVIGASFQEIHDNVLLPNGRHGVPMKNSFVENMAMKGEHYNRLGALVFSVEGEANTMTQSEVTNYWSRHGLSNGVFLRFENQSIISLPEERCFVLLFDTIIVDMKYNKPLLRDAIVNANPNTYLHSLLKVHGDNLLKWCNSQEKEIR